MQDFTTKRNALFACLDDASKELKGTALDQGVTDQHTVNALQNIVEERSDGADIVMNYRRGRNVTATSTADSSLQRMRGKESIFKKPELPIGRCLKPRKTPDYQINPHKWKKYSLIEVDISDRTNTAAAFAFLKQIDDQREAASGDNMDTDNEKKIEFKKSSKLRRQLKAIATGELADAEVDKPKLKGSKLVMPEYVIGQKQTRPKRQEKEKRQRAAGTLRLSHLQAEDDEIDDV